MSTLSKLEILDILKQNNIIAKVKLKSTKTGYEVNCKYDGEKGLFKASKLFDGYNISVTYGFY